MASDFEKRIFDIYENNLFNLQRMHAGQIDGVGTNHDAQYGIVVITIQMNKSDTSRIANMHWTMPRGTRTMAAFCSLLAQHVAGMTIEEASKVTLNDIANANNLKWPTSMGWHSVAAIQALHQALNMTKKL